MTDIQTNVPAKTGKIMLVGLGPGAVEHMTGRARAVSTRNLMALARFFGCSMQELIDAFSGKTE